MAAPKIPFHEQVATRIIRQLEEGVAPWQKEWEPGNDAYVMPYNPTTGNRYKGVNAVNLLSEGRDDPRWMTYKQAQGVDAQVRRDEKGTSIQFWKFEEEKSVRQPDGSRRKERVRLDRPRVFFSSVFNAEQIEGLPMLEQPTQKSHEWERVERAEKLLQQSGADIRHADQSRAYYSPGSDYIVLPEQRQFHSASAYYATAIHELGHWTGHPSRLDRDLAHRFGTEGYAREELRAEIASLITGAELQLGHDPSKHAAYVGSWIKALRDDPLEIVRASSDAEKINKFVMSFDRSQEAMQERQSDAQNRGQVHSRGERSDRATTLEAAAERAVEHISDPASRARVAAALRERIGDHQQKQDDQRSSGEARDKSAEPNRATPSPELSR